MCGILVHKGKGDNSKIRFRGQDHTSEYKVQSPKSQVPNPKEQPEAEYIFVHNLLSVTGQFTKQPFVDEENKIVCVYNGEIYNHPFELSDGEVLIPLYKKYGKDFVKHLDGEFAIVMYDFEKRIAIFATDPFATKPLYVNGTECGSYRSGVGGEKMRPNTIRIVNMDSGKFSEDIIHVWDWTNQHKQNYNDWIRAFERSVKKRAYNGCFIGLSSGYDSGAIACELLKQSVSFKAYSFRGKENQQVLEDRVKRIKEHEWFSPLAEVKEIITQRIDNEKYSILYNGKDTGMKALDDGGIYGEATMCMLANLDGRKVALSGQGADEILSDYSLFPGQSELKGVFPKNLSMWHNFQSGCQESYLMKTEFAGGAFNIETRYPFLDKELVQEFLWLAPELKNKNYKAPLKEYFMNNKFPFDENKKIGFSVTI